MKLDREHDVAVNMHKFGSNLKHLHFLKKRNLSEELSKDSRRVPACPLAISVQTYDLKID